MSDSVGRRELSQQFISDLKDGLLSPLLQRARGDTSLDMQIRQDSLNVYYRGGSLLRVSKVKGKPGYGVFSNPKYAQESERATLTPNVYLVSPEHVKPWLDGIPRLKDTMDRWFGKHPKDERASQQLVVHENNVGAWAAGTDYFIIDIEYATHHGARFDLVALCWESEATIRKLQKGYLPKLVVIEMKAGDGALNGKAGLSGHYRQWCDFFGNEGRVNAFKQEMLTVLRQKRALGLIPALADNKNEIKAVAKDVDAVFLLANHDPASSKLSDALDEIQTASTSHPSGFDVKFAVATFMGFGLYKQGIRSLKEFGVQLQQMAAG